MLTCLFRLYHPEALHDRGFAMAQLSKCESLLIFACRTHTHLGRSRFDTGAFSFLRSISRSNILQRFEAVFTNEFRTIRGKCSSLVPQGPGYQNVSIENQVCTVVGSQSGQLYVDGNLFAGLSHEYYWSNTWRVSIIAEIP